MKKITLKLGQVVYLLALPFLRLIFKNRQTTRLLLIKDHQLVVIRNYLSDGSWGLPGGGIKKNETPLQSLSREVKEEIDLDLSILPLQYLGFFVAHNRFVSYGYHLWLIRNDQINLNLLKTHRPLEIAQISTLDILKIKDYFVEDEIKSHLEQILGVIS
jgi:ADP-ribose pyrophosphatase YjhB (NUDIX family)